MNYAKELLQTALRNELIALESANEHTAGKGFTMDEATKEAFRISKQLALERIPQLKEAIAKIK